MKKPILNHSNATGKLEFPRSQHALFNTLSEGIISVDKQLTLLRV